MHHEYFSYKKASPIHSLAMGVFTWPKKGTHPWPPDKQSEYVPDQESEYIPDQKREWNLG